MKLLEEYQRIISTIPRPRGIFSWIKDNSTNFGDNIFRSDNIYYGFDTAKSNKCIYIFDSVIDTDCIDITHCIKCERCYECVDCHKCYDSLFCDDCDQCIECYFCSRCKNCSNCFGCVLLENKQNCIANKQYTKEEYEKKLKELLQQPPEVHNKNLEQFSINYPHKYIRQSLDSNVNTPFGNYVYNSVNSYFCFDGAYLTDCGYIYDSDFMKNCWDCAGKSVNGIDCYECIDIAECNNCFYCLNSVKCSNCVYCYWCRNCLDCIGCALLTNRQYCVLNRQLDKETYEKIKQLIRQDINADLSPYIKPATNTMIS
jgi:hypothetical protein